jgi:thiol-disulfide isomerase/thioredoxin
MKNIAIALLLIMTTISCTNAQKQFSSKSKKQKLTTLEGKEVSFGDVLKQHKGKTIVLEVWASWCSDCVKAMPKVKELQANNPNVVFLFVSMDKAVDKWKAGIEKHELKGEHFWANDEKMMKGAFGKSIDLDWIPRYIVIDKEQNVVIYRAIETDFEKINTTLKTLE